MRHQHMPDTNHDMDGDRMPRVEHSLDPMASVVASTSPTDSVHDSNDLVSGLTSMPFANQKDVCSVVQ